MALFVLLQAYVNSAIVPTNLYARVNTYGALDALRPYTEWNSSAYTHEPCIEPIYDYSWQSISRLARQTASHILRSAKKGVMSLISQPKNTPSVRQVLEDEEGGSLGWDGWTGEETLTELQRSFIDGEITVKVGNISGYMLYYPNGSLAKWTKDILGEYLCQDTYSKQPWKNASDEFDLVGFVFAVLLGLLVSAAITATFPTLILIKTQNEDLAIQNERQNQALAGIAAAVRARNTGVTDEDDEDNKARKEKLRRMDIISMVWMAIGSVVCVALSIFIADMVLATYGARHILKVVYVGECYTFNVSNIMYEEPDDVDLWNAMRILATTRANNIIEKNRAKLRHAKAARYANDTSTLLSTDDFMTHDALRNVRRSLLSSTTKGARSSIGMTYKNGSRITLADFDQDIERLATARMAMPLSDMRPLDVDPKYTSAASVAIKTNEAVTFTTGCDASFYSPKADIMWHVVPESQPECKDITMFHNRRQENTIKTGCPSGKGKQKIDKPEWATHDFGYSCVRRGCGCCKPCAACNQWVCNNIFWQVTNETWQDCVLKHVGEKLERNGEDVTQKYRGKYSHFKVTDARMYWNYGWLAKGSDGAEIIVKDATFSNGLHTSIHTADPNAAADIDADVQSWLRGFVSGNNPTSYSLEFPLNPETVKYTPNCVEQFTIKLDKDTSDLVEFTNWCSHVKAQLDNRTGVVHFSTPDTAACSLEVKMSADAGGGSNTLRISNTYPASAFGAIMWKCKTNAVDKYIGDACDSDVPFTAFEAAEYTTLFDTLTVNNAYSDSETPSDTGIDLKKLLKLGKFDNLKTVAIFFCYIIAGVIVIVIVWKGVAYCRKHKKKDKSSSSSSPSP